MKKTDRGQFGIQRTIKGRMLIKARGHFLKRQILGSMYINKILNLILGTYYLPTYINTVAAFFHLLRK